MRRTSHPWTSPALHRHIQRRPDHNQRRVGEVRRRADLEPARVVDKALNNTAAGFPFGCNVVSSGRTHLEDEVVRCVGSAVVYPRVERVVQAVTSESKPRPPAVRVSAVPRACTSGRYGSRLSTRIRFGIRFSPGRAQLRHSAPREGVLRATKPPSHSSAPLPEEGKRSTCRRSGCRRFRQSCPEPSA